ncbi:MAG: histidine phosphatase family protein [Solirubrobacterales bacterium]|nr:histidine phosphatase family protein [Solirubrobacterales bacterium]
MRRRGPESGTPPRQQIVVVRHGQTEWSKSGQHTSRTDLPLIDEGRDRAQALAPKLAGWSFSLVLSSPLERARETAELAGFGGRLELEENLREWDYGDYEGLTTPEIRSENGGWDLWRDGCPGGELPGEVAVRADRALARLRAAGGDALVFAHGHILRVLTARWLAMGPEAGARFQLEAGALCVLGYERETEVVQRWNA